jgi:D-3-phosphoglycerate dehydrogenase
MKGNVTMKIAVIHDYADVFRGTRAYPRLKDHEVIIHTDAYTDPARVIEQVAGCDALLLTQQRVPLTRQTIERLPGLRFISQTGRNTNHLDIPACTQRGIVVSAGGSSGGDRTPYSTTAELTWGLILASLRHLPYEVERLKQGHWHSTVGERLFGRTLGVYAFGHIGAAVARVGKAFGMRVVCWGREGSTARAEAEGFEIATSREAFFESADVLSLHLPGIQETRGIITADDLGRMKPTALLVNTSRAPIIAEGALVAALQKGRPGFAAVDVFEEEPVIGAKHPLLQMPNALCTPHLGYAERDGYEALYTLAVDQLLAFAEGKPINVVNPEVVGKR